eukprot:TRINITY_DN15839_c0_g1_i1.p1 TRINITY_DN15839_c0_g1~~TRINITY_DN15839_c0_g1_i1.p1  ORF type:complete len:211 (+),score=55.84 TRINITY_DN15839_c0_g1_i1:141-773(+)
MFRRSVIVQQLTRSKALQVLGLENGATMVEVKKAYKLSAMQNHPDVTMHLSAEEQHSREEVFKRINVAVTFLEECDLSEELEEEVTPTKSGHSRFHSSLTPEQKTKKRIILMVKQLQKTNTIQHLPLPKGTDVAEVAAWVNEELLKNNLSGLSIHAQQYGPFGTPCITVRGASQHAAFKKIIENDEQQLTPVKKAARSARMFINWLKEPI